MHVSDTNKHIYACTKLLSHTHKIIWHKILMSFENYFLYQYI